MAYSAYGATVGSARPEPELVALTQTNPKVNGVVTIADQTAVAAAVATLVADAASPTQAHVTTLANAWAALLTSSTASSDVVILFNPANVLTVSYLKRIFSAALQAARGGLGGLTP